MNKGYYIATNHNKAVAKHVNENEADKPYYNKPISEIAIGPETVYTEPNVAVAEAATPVAQTEQNLQADAAVVENAPQPASVKHKAIQKKIAAAESTKRIIEKVNVSA